MDLRNLTEDEVKLYQQQFHGYPDALMALDLIAENDGNLRSTTKLLALQAGMTNSSTRRNESDILDELSNRFRKTICDELFINDLLSGLLVSCVSALAATGQIPVAVATPVVIYLSKIGLRTWCQAKGD
ncbi:MAG: hypothetical protein AAFY33_12415 [Cyanobacteria bacterium J06643_4]